MSTISKKINQLTRLTSEIKLDINQTRILILKIAEQMNLFAIFNTVVEINTISHGETLSARLRQGVAIEQLIEFISTFSLKYGDIISALIDSGEATDISEAIAIFNFLVKERYC